MRDVSSLQYWELQMIVNWAKDRIDSLAPAEFVDQLRRELTYHGVVDESSRFPVPDYNDSRIK